MSANAITPAGVLGHSYGGKVALALAAHAQERPLQVWVIDSTPEVKAPSGSAWDMLRVVRSLPDRFASREEAQRALMANGYDLPVAQWMGTNLVRDGEAFRWQLDFDVMERLLLDFFRTDMWARGGASLAAARDPHPEGLAIERDLAGGGGADREGHRAPRAPASSGRRALDSCRTAGGGHGAPAGAPALTTMDA